jgi:hypothetical protein
VVEVALGGDARQKEQVSARLLVPTRPGPCRSISRGIHGACPTADAHRRLCRTDFGCGTITS